MPHILQPEDYIVPLNMNGLHGRMLRLPRGHKRASRNILLVYGMHASLERYFSLAQALQEYGAVTMPDLPGHGGMESFHKIGQKPTLDNLADYLAAFIKLEFKNKRLTIVGMSLGFVVATRMLQKYPDLVKKVDLVISVVGFTHRDDFKLKFTTTLPLKVGASIFMHRIPAIFFRYVVLHKLVIWSIYTASAKTHPKMKAASRAERNARIAYEIKLWHDNDVRTWTRTGKMVLKLDLTGKQVNLPVYHIAVESDQYFDNNIVEQHMRCIYRDFIPAQARMATHAPTVIADVHEASALFPPLIREVLAAA